MPRAVKAVMPAVYFGGDVGNPDTNGKFWADMQGWAVAMNQPDPQVFMEQYTSWQVSQKANQWARRNRGRWWSPVATSCTTPRRSNWIPSNAPLSAWDSDTWVLGFWSRDT